MTHVVRVVLAASIMTLSSILKVASAICQDPAPKALSLK